MKIAIRPNNLEILEQELQQSLLSEILSAPLKVNCNLYQESLLIVVEHTADLQLDVKATWGRLEATINSKHPEFVRKVGVCLKVTGEKQPYQFYSFNIKPQTGTNLVGNVISDTIARSIPVVSGTKKEDLSAEKLTVDSNNWRWEDISYIHDQQVNRSNPQDVENGSLDLPSSASFVKQEAENNNFGDYDFFGDNPFDPQDLDLVLNDEPVVIEQIENNHQIVTEAPLKDEVITQKEAEPVKVFPPAKPVIKNSSQGVSLPLVNILLGLGVAGAFFALCFYVLSRPCVIGECRQINFAQKLAEKAAGSVDASKFSVNPVVAQENLEKAIAELNTIPLWSPRYQEAQKLIGNYQEQSAELEQLFLATEQVKQAVILAEKSPHPTERWQKIEKLWRSSIEILEGIPTDSYIYKLAQDKIPNYQKNLAAVQKRSMLEKQAEQKLNAAMNAANIAKAQEGIAQEFDTWQIIDNNWQTAYNGVVAVPKGTLAYQKAQELLPEYQRKLTAARDRSWHEKIGKDAYKEGLELSEQARVFEQRESWLQSVEYWEQARNSLANVPKKSSYYAEAQTLIKTYESSLNEAEIKLKQAQKIQQTTNDLEKICKGSPMICGFELREDEINIKLTSAYIEKIKQMATKSGKNTRNQIEKHLKTLQIALEAISDNAEIPINVYNPEGELLGKHKPKK